MAYRYSGRSGANLENEQRRLQREPVSVWKKEWVLPTGANGNKDVKVLKWIKTGESIKFDQLHEEEHLIGEETIIAMEVDQPRPSVALSTAAEDTNASTPAAAPLIAAAELEGESTPQLGDGATAVAANDEAKPLTPANGESSAAHTPVNISAAPAHTAVPIASMLDTPPVERTPVEQPNSDALPLTSSTVSQEIPETISVEPPPLPPLAVPPIDQSGSLPDESVVKDPNLPPGDSIVADEPPTTTS